MAFVTDIMGDDNISGGSTSSESRKVIGKLIWFISTARNIFIVLISATMAYIFDIHGVRPFVLTGKSFIFINFFFIIPLDYFYC